MTDDVINFCETQGIVREEFTLKSRFLLQNGLAYLGAITNENLLGVYMERTQLQRLEAVKYDDFNDLPRGLKATYVSWKYGFPLNLSHATFYRHRLKLLSYGIDISVPSNVHMMPLRVRTIDLRAVSAPDWYLQKYA